MPDKLFLEMLVITIQVGSVQGETYWTFYTHTPVLRPVTWGDDSVLVYINDTRVLGGHPGPEGPCWQQSALFNYSRQVVDPPLCGVHQPINGCLLLGQVHQTAVGGATISGPWDKGRYIFTVSFIGLPNTNVVVAPTHPPLTYCTNSTIIKLDKSVHWIDCAHSLATQHNLRHSSDLVFNWFYHLTGPSQGWITPGVYASPILTTLRCKMQHELWHIWATSDYVNFSSTSTYNPNLIHSYGV